MADTAAPYANYRMSPLGDDGIAWLQRVRADTTKAVLQITLFRISKRKDRAGQCAAPSPSPWDATNVPRTDCRQLLQARLKIW